MELEQPKILAFYTSLITRSTLVIACVACIVRVYAGSRYWANIYLTLMLMMTSVCGFSAAVLLCILQNDWYKQGVTPLHPQSVIDWFAISFGTRDVFFNVSHQILAWRYHVVARDTIKLLKKEEQTEEQVARDNFTYWVLMILNIVMPLLTIPATMMDFSVVFAPSPSHVSAGVALFYALTGLGTGLMQIISGFYLIGSILKIRAFFLS